MAWQYTFNVNDRVKLTNDYGVPRGVHSWYSVRGLDRISPSPKQGEIGTVKAVLFDGVSPYYKVEFDGYGGLFTTPIHALIPHKSETNLDEMKMELPGHGEVTIQIRRKVPINGVSDTTFDIPICEPSLEKWGKFRMLIEHRYTQHHRLFFGDGTVERFLFNYIGTQTNEPR